MVVPSVQPPEWPERPHRRHSLTDPAAVVFIHSYSAANPYDASTLAGRWLNQGAFVYYGSVNEPFLTAFRTPQLVADLFLRGVPLGGRRQANPPRGFRTTLAAYLRGRPSLRLQGIASRVWSGLASIAGPPVPPPRRHRLGDSQVNA